MILLLLLLLLKLSAFVRWPIFSGHNTTCTRSPKDLSGKSLGTAAAVFFIGHIHQTNSVQARTWQH